MAGQSFAVRPSTHPWLLAKHSGEVFSIRLTIKTLPSLVTTGDQENLRSCFVGDVQDFEAQFRGEGPGATAILMFNALVEHRHAAAASLFTEEGEVTLDDVKTLARDMSSFATKPRWGWYVEPYVYGIEEEAILYVRAPKDGEPDDMGKLQVPSMVDAPQVQFVMRHGDSGWKVASVRMRTCRPETGCPTLDGRRLREECKICGREPV